MGILTYCELSERPVANGGTVLSELRFPVSEYYSDRVIDGETISRAGGWWNAALLIKDPRTDRPFVAFYRWQKVEGTWKTRKSFSCRSRRIWRGMGRASVTTTC